MEESRHSAGKIVKPGQENAGHSGSATAWDPAAADGKGFPREEGARRESRISGKGDSRTSGSGTKWTGTKTAIALLGLVLLIALPIRLLVVSRAAMISRDGTTFIWYAQGLSRDPLAEIRAQRQHPLYPAMVLGAHYVVTGLGAAFPNAEIPNDPVLSWQTAGVAVTLIGGLLAVIGVYALTVSIFGQKVETSKSRNVETSEAVSPQTQQPSPRLGLRDGQLIGLIAAALAALAAEFCQLSADVLTDMLHLALYLFALALGIGGVRRRSYGRLVACGGISGLAFLIRPEGAEPAVVVAAVALLWSGWPAGARVKGFAAVALAGLAVATPYMLVTGKLVQKKAITQFVSETSKSRKVERSKRGELSAVSYQLSARNRVTDTTPLGLVSFDSRGPRVARSSGQPWAGGCSPVGAGFLPGRASGYVQSALICCPLYTFQAGRLTGNSRGQVRYRGRRPRLEPDSSFSTLKGSHWLSNEAPICVNNAACSSLVTQRPLVSPPSAQLGTRPPRGAAATASALSAGSALSVLQALGLVFEKYLRCLRVSLLIPAVVWIILGKRRRGLDRGAESEVDAEICGRDAIPDYRMGLRVLGAVCGLHLTIVLLLIMRFDYWDLFSMRHVVVLAAMTLPLAAAGVLEIASAVTRHRGRAVSVVLIVLVAPTLPWMLEARYADEVYLRQAGEWIRSQQPIGPGVLTTRNQIAFYANGRQLWAPLDTDINRYLGEARGNRPDWIVFDERRMLKMSPTFFKDLAAACRPGELVLANTIEQPHRKGVERALIYRYNPG